MQKQICGREPMISKRCDSSIADYGTHGTLNGGSKFSATHQVWSFRSEPVFVAVETP